MRVAEAEKSIFEPIIKVPLGTSPTASQTVKGACASYPISCLYSWKKLSKSISLLKVLHVCVWMTTSRLLPPLFQRDLLLFCSSSSSSTLFAICPVILGVCSASLLALLLQVEWRLHNANHAGWGDRRSWAGLILTLFEKLLQNKPQIEKHLHWKSCVLLAHTRSKGTWTLLHMLWLPKFYCACTFVVNGTLTVKTTTKDI